METQQLGKFCDQFAIDKPFSSKPRKPAKDYPPYHKKKKYSKKKIEDKEQRKFARQDKKWNKNKSIICHKCGKKVHYAQTCWVKQKINNLNSDESSESELSDSSSTSEDLKVLRNENLDTSSESECQPCRLGQPCLNKDSDNEEQFYKMQSQFQDLEINMLSFKTSMELLEEIKDPESRLKIIDKLNAAPDTSKSQEDRREIINPKPYQMNEVYRRIWQKTEIEKPTSTHDLIIVIYNLKKEIHDIKTNNKYLDQRISKMEKGKEVITFATHDIETDKQFLSTLEMFITQKWHIKVTLLIDNYYSKEFTALVDSGEDLNVIQEGLIPMRRIV